MAPPVTGMKARLDGNVREQDIFNGTLIAGEHTDPTVGAIDDKILKNQIANIVATVANSNAAGTTLNHAIGGGDVLRYPLFVAEAGDANAVVASSNITIGNTN